MDLRILRNLKRGPYVEFNTTGDHWDDSSIFLDEAVFGIFSHSFTNSHENFNYYGSTTFGEFELQDLHRELVEFDSELREITDFESFVRLISSLPLGGNFLSELETEGMVDLNLQWDPIVEALKQISLTLLKLAEGCARENKALWVLGI